MKPRELYSGQAPAAMGKMGDNWAEVGRNIANTTAAAYDSVGKSISGAIVTGAGLYKEHKDLQASNEASKKMLDNPKTQEMLGLTQEQVDKIKIEADNLGTKGAAKMFESFIPMAFKSSLLKKSEEAQSMQPWNAQAAAAAYRQVAPPIYGGGSADAASTPFTSVYHPDNNSGLGSVNAKSLPLPVDDTSGEDMPVPYRSGRKQPFLFNDESLFPRR